MLKRKRKLHSALTLEHGAMSDANRVEFGFMQKKGVKPKLAPGLINTFTEIGWVDPFPPGG